MISGRSGKINVLPCEPVRRDTGPYIPSWKCGRANRCDPGNRHVPSYEGDMLSRELAAQKEIAAKKKRVGVLVNKSGYQYITEGMDPTTLGRK